MKKSIVMKNPIWKKLFLPMTIVAAMLATGLTSCNSDDPGDNGMPSKYSLVTLKSNTPGMGTIFTFRTGETTPLITLTSSLNLDTAYRVRVGDRLVIGYDVPDGRPEDMSGPINLMNFRKVYNDTIRTATPNIISNWNMAQVSNTQVWRTGNYINAYCYLPVLTPAVNLCLYADLASIENGSVNMYLTLSNPNANPGQISDCYSSYHIGDFLHKHPEVHTFVINVAGSGTDPRITMSNISYLPGE